MSGMKQLGITVGSEVIAKRWAGIAEKGERGVCYEVYTLDNRRGYSFIFENGGYDGFAPDEVDLCLTVTGNACQQVTGYEFENVIQLAQDFRAGVFDEAFV